MNEITKNITNSGLEQISFKKNSMIYKVDEKPKFAYYIYNKGLFFIFFYII